ncbi:MAG TPA: FtsX-like permease family protein, partial [Pseudonocardiaceae bacterium]|nr:FtsX-like permease family protein [Pseudonocardiaceae bacterium]
MTDFARWRGGWPRDLALGIRLAVGGGRTSLARLVLGTIGIGMATAVLLVAASVGHFMSAEHARETAGTPGIGAVPGVAPLDVYGGGTQFLGTYIGGEYVRATGPNSPVPPGLDRVPGPGEIVLSPALAGFLSTSDGALLRPRFPQRVIGLIGPAGLRGPQQLTYYAGLAVDQIPSNERPQQVFSFGWDGGSLPVGPLLQALVVIGAVALLMPILIMVAISSRIAGAQRDRRLAALRLVGAGSRQVRRIAAAESLASAGTGLVLGAALFLGFRQIVPNVEVEGISAFTSDITPPWPLVVLIVLLVPVLSVASALFALRRTVIEPLGVVRGGRPVRRRLWWRAGLVVAGVGLLFLAHDVPTQSVRWIWIVALGSSALLVGVPVLLPWLLERAVSAVQGGPVSWQLAVRRLQLESGTAARVIGGVAVVLAGAIALQTVVAATSARLTVSSSGGQAIPGLYTVHSDAK